MLVPCASLRHGREFHPACFKQAGKIQLPAHIVKGLIGYAMFLTLMISLLDDQRRSCLAASAIGRPPVLMLDEPSVGMDAASQQLLVDDLLQRKQADQTSMIISHDRDFLTFAQAEAIEFSDWQLPA